MENEIWKPVVGYEGLYEVSNIGNVRSLRWRGGHKTHNVFQRINKNGYYDLILVRNKTIKYVLAHQLVAQAFIPNPEGKRCIDHIDGNRRNNRVENLRWCTHKENSNNPISRQRQVAAQRIEMKKKWERGCCERIKKPVLQFSLGGEFVSRWGSASDAARAYMKDTERLATSSGKITGCCRLENRQAYGFIWTYEGGEGEVPRLVELNKIPKTIRVKVFFPDGSTKIFESVNKAAKELGITNNDIRHKDHSAKHNISWELLNTKTCYENRWGGHRKDYHRNK